MIVLDEKKEHQEKVARKIEEFRKIDELLKDHGNKFSEITTEVSELESELIVWKKDKEELKKNPANREEVKEWIKQIETIESNIKSKNKDLEDLQNKLDDISSKKEFLRENLKDLKNAHVKYLKNQLQEYNQKSDKDKSSQSHEALIYSLDLLRNLWKVQNKSSDLNVLVEFLKTNEFDVDLNLLNDLFEESEIHNLPSIVSEFVNGYLEDLTIDKLIDPTCKVGSLIFNLETDSESELTVFLKDPNDEEAVDLLYPDKSIKFINFDELKTLPDGHFDVVSGNSDVRRNWKIDFDDIHDEEEIIRFLKASLKLKEKGIGFFILNPELRLNWGDKSVFTNLEKFDLHIDSIIRLSAEIFPDRDSNNTLIIIKREKPDKIFLGELNNNSKDILLENLKKRKSGKVTQYGTLTELEVFYSFPNFLSKIESEYFGLATGVEPLKFKDIVKEVRSYGKFSETEEDFNYIFLPLNSNAKAVLTSQSFEFKPERYLQIFLEPEIALSDYVARFYNTQLGKKIRESLNIGSAIPQLSKRLLLNSALYLPDLESQIEIIRADSSISELNTLTESYRTKLWKSPAKARDILKELHGLDEAKSEEKFEQWIESLPYPLASIIWASSTVSDYSVKVKYLLDFFEAFSQFNYAFMISALSRDQKFFEEEYERCKRNTKPETWYLKPTFGTWNFVGTCIASTIRKLLKNNEKRAKCLELFGNPEEEFLERICDSKLYDILLEVTNYRNQWDAHGPRVSPQEYKNRFKIMEGALLRFYQIISDAYEKNFLLIPEISNFREGIHYYNIKRFMGTRAPFKSDTVETISLMDSNKIYFLATNQRASIELLPLVIVENETCYFYNSLYEKDHKENGNLRYVSYHDSENAEITVLKEKLDPVFSLLECEFD